MCGICGEIDFDHQSISIEPVKKMCRILAHRGPDDEGMAFFRGNHAIEVKSNEQLPLGEGGFEVALGHRRLSVIDLSEAAHQPMCNEDRTLWVVFNGEIYNFQTLRIELEKKGHLFKSKSDTEVILHAYEAWGIECLHRFRGMFAFGLWDGKLRRLFMARDRLGKKPLVYAIREGRFLFASEIKALLQAPCLERRVNPFALDSYLTYQYIPSPNTIFSGIYKLPPAHYLLYEASGKIEVKSYWKLDFSSNHETACNLPELCELIRKELARSVELRLISDVPLGAFLSGGIDSSIIVGMMAKLGGKPVKTFSIGFEEQEFDELSYARLASKYFSTEHHEFIVKPNALEILPKLVWHYSEPFADASAIPTYYVANMTKGHVKVVLTGDAGDENFAGYPRYLRSQMVALFTKIPGKFWKDQIPSLIRQVASFHWREKTFNRLADFVEMLSSDQAKNYSEQIKYFNRQEKDAIYTEEFRRSVEHVDPLDFLLKKYEEAGSDDLLNKLLYVDINTYLSEDLLPKVDIATMANSIEARIPFLDHPFMEFVAGIPARWKLRGLTHKYILKKAFSDFLPESILKRRKMGFGVPVARWFRKELKDYVYGILLENRTLDRGYFRQEGVRRLLDEHLALRYDHSIRLLALLILELWFRIFMDQDEGLVAASEG